LAYVMVHRCFLDWKKRASFEPLIASFSYTGVLSAVLLCSVSFGNLIHPLHLSHCCHPYYLYLIAFVEFFTRGLRLLPDKHDLFSMRIMMNRGSRRISSALGSFEFTLLRHYCELRQRDITSHNRNVQSDFIMEGALC